MKFKFVLMLLTVIAAGSGMALGGTQPEPDHKPVIRSVAELDAWLAATPPDAPPLGWLSPGERARFLAKIRAAMTPRGLAMVPLAPAIYELTPEQAHALYALFDAEAYVEGLGITPSERARLDAERAAEARLRGCAPGTCTPSRIEQRFDAFSEIDWRGTERQTEAGKAKYRARFAEFFASFLQPDVLRATSHSDLRLLHRAASSLVFFVQEPADIAYLRAVVAEMQHRGIADAGAWQGLHRALVAGRDFIGAQALAAAHPEADLPALPRWQAPGGLPADEPTALSVDPAADTMTREAVDLAAPLRIVIIAACHFSADAARAISADPALDKLFAEHAVWLADQGESIVLVRDWNEEFPSQPMRIAWRNGEWGQLEDWAMPTFYVFREGALVDQWSGWPADTGMSTLQEHLGALGLLQP